MYLKKSIVFLQIPPSSPRDHRLFTRVQKLSGFARSFERDDLGIRNFCLPEPKSPVSKIFFVGKCHHTVIGREWYVDDIKRDKCQFIRVSDEVSGSRFNIHSPYLITKWHQSLIPNIRQFTLHPLFRHRAEKQETLSLGPDAFFRECRERHLSNSSCF